MSASRLSDIAIQRELGRLPGWSRRGDTLVKTYQFAAFLRGVEFVNRVAQAAEAADHHPDIEIRWNRVKLRWWTHVKKAITERDAQMAARTNELV